MLLFFSLYNKGQWVLVLFWSFIIDKNNSNIFQNILFNILCIYSLYIFVHI